MSTLFWTTRKTAPITRDEDLIRSTTHTIDGEAGPSEAQRAPDFNELVNDPRESGGLTPNQMASHVVPSRKHALHITNANTDFGFVDREQSAKGTAARREVEGEWGHGTLQVAEGIEPPYNPDRGMTNLYFAANRPIPNGSTSDYMTPIEDQSAVENAAELARQKALSTADAYRRFYKAVTGNA